MVSSEIILKTFIGNQLSAMKHKHFSLFQVCKVVAIKCHLNSLFTFFSIVYVDADKMLEMLLLLICVSCIVCVEIF